ncbi:MAG: TAT-variant-translocated molybdopterin oxidoreductase, partial [Planctomycetaceae bacterium]
MPQIFHPAMNTVSRVSIFGAVFLVAAAVLIGGLVVRSSYVTEAGVIHDQPVPFSHQHHVTDCGIDCRYCHTSVEHSPFAGIPATEVCMNCHAYLYADSEMLEPVRESFRSGEPLVWTRVHDLPDFAYFDHSIHVSKGIGCASCHGRVDQMPLMWRTETLDMEWCLDCHRHPAEHVRPREFVFRMEGLEELAETAEFREYLQREYPPAEYPKLTYENPDLLFTLREQLMKDYRIESETNC